MRIKIKFYILITPKFTKCTIKQSITEIKAKLDKENKAYNK